VNQVSSKEAFRKANQPAPHDGRDIDTDIAALTGEASGQLVKPRDERMQEITPRAWGQIPSVAPSDPTYYDRPLLKAPVWEWDIPVYYFLGGAAGAALVLGAAAQLDGDKGLKDFVQRSHWVGIAGSSLGAAFLIHDLGRPSRFLNMMRVFRPTSPMNMGVWILSGAAPMAITAGLFGARRGLLGAVGSAAGYGAGLFGAGLASYTGVLVANTAIPIWQHSRRVLPPLFAASAMSTAASILDLLSENARAMKITLLFGTAGRVAELTAGLALEGNARMAPRIARPLREGVTGTLWRAANMLTAASLVVSLIPGQSRTRRKWAGLFGALGSLALRFAVHYAGAASARDARASFQHQRAGFGGAEVTGRAAVTGPDHS
jgi:formate-dependent nitrite reductase membrane component NrfD